MRRRTVNGRLKRGAYSGAPFLFSRGFRLAAFEQRAQNSTHELLARFGAQLTHKALPEGFRQTIRARRAARGSRAGFRAGFVGGFTLKTDRLEPPRFVKLARLFGLGGILCRFRHALGLRRPHQRRRRHGAPASRSPNRDPPSHRISPPRTAIPRSPCCAPPASTAQTRHRRAHQSALHNSRNAFVLQERRHRLTRADLLDRLFGRESRIGGGNFPPRV